MAESRELYKQAAQAEAAAIQDLGHSKRKTLGITVVSTAALWFKANEFAKAQQIIDHWLKSDLLPDFAIEQLKSLQRAMQQYPRVSRKYPSVN